MIRCEATAHSLDLAAHWPLSVHPAYSPLTALRWLRWQAGVLADRLDPDPLQAAWLPARALRPVSAAVPDAPMYLRSWRLSLDAHEDVLDQLNAGHAVTLSTHDDTAYYTLTAVPAPFYVPPWAPPASVTQVREVTL